MAGGGECLARRAVAPAWVRRLITASARAAREVCSVILLLKMMSVMLTVNMRDYDKLAFRLSGQKLSGLL